MHSSALASKYKYMSRTTSSAANGQTQKLAFDGKTYGCTQEFDVNRAITGNIK